MFQFTGFPSIRYVLAYGYCRSSAVGFPIQKSTDYRIFAPPRGLSQLITSFFGSQCQGILPALFFAYIRSLNFNLKITDTFVSLILSCFFVNSSNGFHLNRLLITFVINLDVLTLLVFVIFYYSVFKVLILR